MVVVTKVVLCFSIKMITNLISCLNFLDESDIFYIVYIVCIVCIFASVSLFNEVLSACWYLVSNTHCQHNNRPNNIQLTLGTKWLRSDWLIDSVKYIHIYMYPLLSNQLPQNAECAPQHKFSSALNPGFTTSPPLSPPPTSSKTLTISHFWVIFWLCVKTILRGKPFIWKCVQPTGSFLCKSNSFERFCTRTGRLK